MAVPIKEGTTERDWLKLASATAEAGFKALTLGKDGFSAAIIPLFRIAKSLSLDPPEAMKVDDLKDLTNEPLLAYLLILSGYVSDRWREAAENRNRISFENARMDRAHFVSVDLSTSNFESATLNAAMFDAASLGGAKLSAQQRKNVIKLTSRKKTAAGLVVK